MTDDMNARSRTGRRVRRAARTALVATALFTGALAVPACKKSNGGAAPEPAASAATPAATDQQTQPAAASAFSAASYAVSMKAAGPYKAGQPGVVEIVLEAKAPYHCNDKYPYKLKLEESPGVNYPEKVVTRDSVKVEHMQATMSVPFTPESAGTKTITGKYQFSVCSAENCLVEKRDLKLDVNVM